MLNWYLCIKGGCLLEVEELLVFEDSFVVVIIVFMEDLYIVLVEFLFVVVDIQEYIIEVIVDDVEISEVMEIIEGIQIEVDSYIMKVVQQIVYQVSVGYQIIVQNVIMDEEMVLGLEVVVVDIIIIVIFESLIEQVVMMLVLVISEGIVFVVWVGISGIEQVIVIMVLLEDIEILEYVGELVIVLLEGQLEVQMVIVQYEVCGVLVGQGQGRGF